MNQLLQNIDLYQETNPGFKVFDDFNKLERPGERSDTEHRMKHRSFKCERMCGCDRKQRIHWGFEYIPQNHDCCAAGSLSHIDSSVTNWTTMFARGSILSYTLSKCSSCHFSLPAHSSWRWWIISLDGWAATSALRFGGRCDCDPLTRISSPKGATCSTLVPHSNMLSF